MVYFKDGGIIITGKILERMCYYVCVYVYIGADFLIFHRVLSFVLQILPADNFKESKPRPTKNKGRTEWNLIVFVGIRHS